jgi:hypothetical protein
MTTPADAWQIQAMLDRNEPMLITVPADGNPCAEIEMDPLGPGELRPISPTPDTSNAWDDFVVPMLRWMGAGTADDAALIVLSLGRHR